MDGLPRCRQDEVASFEAVYRAERPGLVRYLMSLGAGQHQADDAVQASFARAWDQWDAIRYPRAWLYPGRAPRVLPRAGRRPRGTRRGCPARHGRRD